MPTLEFALDPADVPRLARWSGGRDERRAFLRAGRTVPTLLTWHDTADQALRRGGLALCELPGRWELAHLVAGSPVVPPAMLAEASKRTLLGHELPETTAPVVRLEGRRRVFRTPESDEEVVTIRVLDGQLASRGRPPVCRVTLEGPAASLTPLALAIGQDLALTVPRASLAQQALLATSSEVLPPRALGAPEVRPGTVSGSLATIVGHLLDVMLHWAERVPGARDPEPVHQMRVATRRLRSALSVYRHVAVCQELASLSVPLKLCAARLGLARDWDVFLAGTGARLAETFPGDKRCAAMLRAAAVRRRAAYGELRRFMSGPEFRTLTIALACAVSLRPWDGPEGSRDTSGLQQDVDVFAAAVLAKRLRRVRRAGRGIDSLQVTALHELRKDCKRLRYAAEFFASLFPSKPARRFLDRLADLQEELGLLNDAAAVSGLMAQLGRLERSYAAGLVEGFSAARSGPARKRIVAAWKRFRRVDAFWPG